MNYYILKWYIILLVVIVSGCDSCLYIKYNPFVIKQNIGVVVLARGGSKGIAGKNLATLKNESLIVRSLQTILKVHRDGYLDFVWVSTDHSEIAKQAISVGAQVHIRADYTATDSATSIIAVQEFSQLHPEINILGLVQCTSPFLKPEYLKKAVEYFKSNSVNCVFSVTRKYNLRWSTDTQKLSPLNFNPKHRPRRQDWNGELVENGMFYFAKRNLIKQGIFQDNRCAVVEISVQDSIEIDTLWDLKLVELMLNMYDTK